MRSPASPRLATLTVALALVAACSGPAVTADAHGALEPLVLEAIGAVERGDADGADQRLDALRAEVERLREQGELSDERADEILAVAAQAQALLALLEGDENDRRDDDDAASDDDANEDDEPADGAGGGGAADDGAAEEVSGGGGNGGNSQEPSDNSRGNRDEAPGRSGGDEDAEQGDRGKRDQAPGRANRGNDRGSSGRDAPGRDRGGGRP